jgi:pyridoxamine 5'-phosphate oxidase
MFLNESRREYTKSTLSLNQIQNNPFDAFDSWFQRATDYGVIEPNAMHLSTISSQLTPNSRVVLLKSYSRNGFVFFSNYNSQKGQDIAYNKHVQLSFFWPSMEQQIHISGVAKKATAKISNQYFQTRPKDSQWAAWASNQSCEISDRSILDTQLKNIQRRFPTTVPRPPHWGGYCVVPSKFEFWQGRKNRFHDRLCYQLIKKNCWHQSRLSP